MKPKCKKFTLINKIILALLISSVVFLIQNKAYASEDVNLIDVLKYMSRQMSTDNVHNFGTISEGEQGDVSAILYYSTKTLIIEGPGNMPDYSVSEGAPWYPGIYSDYIERVEIDGRVGNIGVGAFAGCNKLKTVVIENGLTSIGSNAFTGCENLESITIPRSVRTIQDNTFVGSSENMIINCEKGSYAEEFAKENGLKHIYSNGEKPTESWNIARDGSNKVTATLDFSTGRLTISGTGEMQSWSIEQGQRPDWLSEYPEWIRSVSIGSGITNIGSGLFYECNEIKRIDIPNTVKKIETYAFVRCENLHRVKIPKEVTTIEDRAFLSCDALTIEGYRNSIAHTYASNHNIPFIALDFTIITLDKNEGTGGPEQIYCKPGQGIYLDEECTIKMKTTENNITIPKREGYRFEGYYFNDIQAINSSGYLTPTFYGDPSLVGDITFTAKWTKIDVIILNKNGGTGGPEQIYCIYNQGIYLDSECTKKMTPTENAIETPKREGYRFEGYYFDNVNPIYNVRVINVEGRIEEAIYNTPSLGSTILKAKWTKIRNIITLDKNGGNGETTELYNIPSEGVYLDSECTKKMTPTENPITIPTREGYVFEGYFYNSAQAIDSRGYITSSLYREPSLGGNVILKAKWTQSNPDNPNPDNPNPDNPNPDNPNPDNPNPDNPNPDNPNPDNPNPDNPNPDNPNPDNPNPDNPNPDNPNPDNPNPDNPNPDNPNPDNPNKPGNSNNNGSLNGSTGTGTGSSSNKGGKVSYSEATSSKDIPKTGYKTFLGIGIIISSIVAIISYKRIKKINI